MTLNLLIKLPIATDIVFRYFCNNSCSGLHSQHGYANFGFKLIATTTHKYGDRSLYNLSAKTNLQDLETKKSQFDVELIQGFSVQKAGNAIAECEDI